MITKFRVSLLTLLLMPALLHADLSINENHKPDVDYSKLQADKPNALTTIGGPALLGAVVGGFCGVYSGEMGAVLPTALVGTFVGGIWGYAEHSAYSNAFEKAKGLNLHGTAAANNLAGAKAWLEYHKGWYLLKGSHGDPLSKDSADNTALHYAAAADANGIAKEILAVAPKKVTTFEVTGRSKTKKDDVYTSGSDARSGSSMGAAASAVSAIGNAAVGVSAFGSRSNSAGISGSRTSGGNEERTDEKAIHHTYIDLQNEAGKTAANLAARTRAAKTLLMLLEKGAKVNIPDNSGETVESICQNDAELQNALQRAKGK